jgi:hypothetical protein
MYHDYSLRPSNRDRAIEIEQCPKSIETKKSLKKKYVWFSFALKVIYNFFYVEWEGKQR